MKTILEKIVNQIRQDEKVHFSSFSADQFVLEKREKPIDIITSLKSDFFLIAEVKKASPSKGVFLKDFNPLDIAIAYTQGGASAISVITEKNFFCGQKEHLKTIRKKIHLPLLRKDFLIHPYQIYESLNLGADFILLIVACLTDHELKNLYEITSKLGMEALVEVHNQEELDRALAIEPHLIGINNRDLKSFKVDINTSFRLKKAIPSDIYVISESGIKDNDDIHQLKDHGFSGALVGESLLRQENHKLRVMELIHGTH